MTEPTIEERISRATSLANELKKLLEQPDADAYNILNIIVHVMALKADGPIEILKSDFESIDKTMHLNIDRTDPEKMVIRMLTQEEWEAAKQEPDHVEVDKRGRYVEDRSQSQEADRAETPSEGIQREEDQGGDSPVGELEVSDEDAEESTVE